MEMALLGLVAEFRDPKITVPEPSGIWRFYNQADWTQHELRVMAASGVDIHALTAQAIAGNNDPKRFRQAAKSVLFRRLYG